jgi:hypothetical protein
MTDVVRAAPVQATWTGDTVAEAGEGAAIPEDAPGGLP